jgi:hypothetical protein
VQLLTTLIILSIQKTYNPPPKKSYPQGTLFVILTEVPINRDEVEESNANLALLYCLKLDPSTSPSTRFVRSGFARDDKKTTH